MRFQLTSAPLCSRIDSTSTATSSAATFAADYNGDSFFSYYNSQQIGVLPPEAPLHGLSPRAPAEIVAFEI